ncbi:hypothetical protein GCM10009087_40290 [Sphingomonas oligophenolica]|uniref:Uncharacterized protein n=1 Tax=Sphingomonas oligophenolica TaxID=301154 RepID=A0ABU9Y243_9SPHN
MAAVPFVGKDCFGSEIVNNAKNGRTFAIAVLSTAPSFYNIPESWSHVIARLYEGESFEMFDSLKYDADVNAYLSRELDSFYGNIDAISVMFYLKEI